MQNFDLAKIRRMDWQERQRVRKMADVVSEQQEKQGEIEKENAENEEEKEAPKRVGGRGR